MIVQKDLWSNYGKLMLDCFNKMRDTGKKMVMLDGGNICGEVKEVKVHDGKILATIDCPDEKSAYVNEHFALSFDLVESANV